MRFFYKFKLIFVAMSAFVYSDQLDDEYSKDFTDIIEFVYGSNLLSQGGDKSIEAMFKGVDLDCKKVLDIGAGLGGVDFYLTQKFEVSIVGVDKVSRLVDEANARKAKSNTKKLKCCVEFKLQKSEKLDFPDSSFDIVFSKETFLHIEDKLSLIKEIFRVLKPGGCCIILDWLVKDPKNLGENIKEMMVVDDLHFYMSTITDYKKYLEAAGFCKVEDKVLNDLYVDFTSENLETIKNKKNDFVKKFDQETFDYALKTWGIQKRVFEKHEVEVALLIAKKPSNFQNVE